MSKYYHASYGVRTQNKLRRGVAVFLIIGLFFGLSFVLYTKVFREEPASATAKSSDKIQTSGKIKHPKSNLNLPWPGYGYSAYAVPSQGIVASSDKKDESVPVASLAKIITVLAVMNEKPLPSGDKGPTITLDKQDIKYYEEYVAKNGSVVPVADGEKISQYEAIQAVMLPSSNNLAASLARWSFGSIDEYVEYANKMLDDLGLEHTRVADASGFSPKTVSTPDEMAELAYLYMQNPVLREIALQSKANIPVAGLIKNYNALANKNDIYGIKIGNTDEAGRCVILAEISRDGLNEILSVAVVLGADNINIATHDAREILKAGRVLANN